MSAYSELGIGLNVADNSNEQDWHSPCPLGNSLTRSQMTNYATVIMYFKSKVKFVFSSNGAGTTRISTCKRTQLDPYLTPYMQMNSKWFMDLSVRVKL